MVECATCEQQASFREVPRWKAPLLFVGVVLFCPCHLPVTFVLVASVGGALTGASWLFGNQTLVTVSFSLLYVALLVLLWRWVVASRNRERALASLHEAHAAQE